MARIDPTNLLFRDLTPAEANELRFRAYDIVVNGQTRDTFGWPLFQMWAAVACPHDPDRGGLLMISTAFPQRALLSYILWCGENGIVPDVGIRKDDYAALATIASDEFDKNKSKPLIAYARAARAVAEASGKVTVEQALDRLKEALAAKERSPGAAGWVAFVRVLLGESAPEGA